MVEQRAYAIHELGPGASRATIGHVLALSNRIFDTKSSSPTHHSSLEEWSIRLNEPNSILVYGTKPTISPLSPSLQSSSADSPAIIGFIFAHVKTDPSLPYQTLHIWLAGVSEDARGTGVFAALVGKVEKHARSASIQGLSIATFPAKFVKMYAILQKQGWVVKDQKEDGKKVLLMKAL